MKHSPIKVWSDSEYSYPLAFGFVPDITPYIHEDEAVRPCVVVVPGGGYCVVAPPEGEIVAERFYSAGFQAFVFSYTTNLLRAEPLMDQPMRDLGRAIRLIRSRAGEFRVDPSKLTVCGFSAGGHLCGSVCVHFNDIIDPDEALNKLSARPDAAILSYPVITSGEFAHKESFQALLGRDIYEREDEEARRLLEYYSLEKNVTPDVPPCFLWQTVTDELVPVENSILMAAALKEKGVVYAHHLFSKGIHGMSLANEDWAAQRFGDTHCIDQILRLVEAVRSGEMPVPEDVRAALLSGPAQGAIPNDKPDREIMAWPALAITWLQDVLSIDA